MLGNYVTCTHVVSSVTLYRSSLVDLSRSRAVHAVEHDPCCPDPVRLQGATCQAVHYGLCSPLLKLPSFVIPPVALVGAKNPNNNAPVAKTPTPPTTPTSPSGSGVSAVLSSTNPLGLVGFTSKTSATPIPQPASPISSPNSPTKASSSTLITSGQELPLNLISGFDPVTLLAAADLEGQLEALVTSFVARDKSRLAARRSQGSDGTVNSTSNNGGPPGTSSNQNSPIPNDSSKGERRIIRRPGVEVVGGKLVSVSPTSTTAASPTTAPTAIGGTNLGRNASQTSVTPSPEYRRDGGGVKAQIDRFAPRLSSSAPKPDDQVKDASSTSAVNRLNRQDAPSESGAGSGTKRVIHARNHPANQIQSNYSVGGVTTTNSNIVRNGHPQDPTDKYKRVESDATDWIREEEEKLRAISGGTGSQRSTKAGSPERTSGGADSPTIPHPKLTTAQRQHMKERSMSPTDRNQSHVSCIRPFLAKGSVAERVLLFERCPSLERSHQAIHPGSVSPYPSTGLASSGTSTGYQSQSGTTGSGKSSSFYGALKGSTDFHSSKTQGHTLNNKDKENQEPGLKTGSLRRLPKTATRATHNIPRFYYPNGKPLETSTIEETLKRIANVFASLGNNRRVANFEQFAIITKACGLPVYCKAPLFQACGGGSIKSAGVVSCDSFLDFWRRILSTCHEESSRFIRILSRGQRNYIIPEDFITMIQDMIDTHPGLTFLKEAPEFHSRYVHTVIARVFYCVNRSWTGKITVAELRKSNFLHVLKILEEEEDINQITEYFSYEHFYVIYCKFWELDKDHDLFIDKADLSRHNDGAISSRMIERIFSGAVTRGPVLKQGKMSYSEFVWFLISEEDKRHPRSIEYWFRCMDIDGDGFLSMYELEYFYDEQLDRMEALGIETLPFKDCLCQMLDMIRPKVPGRVSLSDLKKCKMTPVFFDTFFNLEKYLDHEQRDPFASQRDHEDGLDISDWDRYAAEEYELLVSEESEQQEDLIYEDYDDGDLPVSINFESMLPGEPIGRGVALSKNTVGGGNSNNRVRPNAQQIINDLEDEDYDYADSDAEYHY